MKILLLCLIGLAVFLTAAVVGLVAGVLMACDDYEGSYSEILPRKTGHLSHGQKIFVFGFALGALASVVGAWLILKISL